MWYSGFADHSEILLSPAFRYGQSVFESLCILRGQPLFLHEHMVRLASAWRDLCGSEVPAALIEKARQSLLTPKYPLPTGMARTYLSLGYAPGPSHPPGPVLSVVFEPLGVGWVGEPWRVDIVAFNGGNAPGGWKTANYWANLRALSAARADGFHETILMTPEGEAMGCACANLAIELEGCWLTPHRRTGARDGVVLAWLRDVVPVRTGRIGPDQLARCTAAILTNSRLGVVPIAQIGRRQLEPHPLAESWSRKYCHEILHS